MGSAFATDPAEALLGSGTAAFKVFLKFGEEIAPGKAEAFSTLRDRIRIRHG
jgi:hypothetical protein